MQVVASITSDDALDTAIDEFEQLARLHRHHPEQVDKVYLFALRDEIDRYETAAGHAPDPPTRLTVLLETEMLRRHLRQRALAELLGIQPTRLSAVLRGKSKLTLDLARRLHQRLGIPADDLLNLPA